MYRLLFTMIHSVILRSKVIYGLTISLTSGTPDHSNHVDEDVRSRLETLEKEGRGMRSHIAKQDELIKSLGKLVERQEHAIHALTGKVEDQDATIPTTNGGEVFDKIKGIRPPRVLMEGPVAFHARIDRYPVIHLNPNDKIPFDVVVTNIGGGYNQNTSVFVAPITGIYMVSASVLTEHAPHKLVQAGLKKNGQLLARVYGYADGAHDQGSVTVATRLDAGDQVWVSLRGPADDSIWGDSFTSFSGCLVMMV